VSPSISVCLSAVQTDDTVAADTVRAVVRCARCRVCVCMCVYIYIYVLYIYIYIYIVGPYVRARKILAARSALYLYLITLNYAFRPSPY
jgi:hypothetical protein